MFVRELRAELIKNFRENNVESPEASSGLLIMRTLGIDKTALLLGDRAVLPEEESVIRSRAARLLSGEPIQYIVGGCEFMSLEFEVCPGVLIPRADTEALVEAVISRLGRDNGFTVADICCGSGIIGISLARYIKGITVVGTDISEEAVSLAQKNAEKNGVLDRVSFIHSDIMSEFPMIDADCVVSNPPYIRTDVIQGLEKRVRDYEPHIALDGGADGLRFYRRLAEAPMLKNGGLLAFEIGYDQGAAVSEILNSHGYKDIEVLPDTEGRDRVALGLKG